MSVSRWCAMVVGSVSGILVGGCEFSPSGAPPDGSPVDAVSDAAPPRDAPVVPAGYEPLDGMSSYYRWSAERVELGKAVADCADDALRATLVIIDDAAENEAIRRFVSSVPTGRQIWLGIQDWHEEGVWRTFAFERTAFTAWLDGEPNDGGPEGEDCAVLLARFDPDDHEGRWNDVDCTLARAFVCEWRAP